MTNRLTNNEINGNKITIFVNRILILIKTYQTEKLGNLRTIEHVDI